MTPAAGMHHDSQQQLLHAVTERIQTFYNAECRASGPDTSQLTEPSGPVNAELCIITPRLKEGRLVGSRIKKALQSNFWPKKDSLMSLISVMIGIGGQKTASIAER